MQNVQTCSISHSQLGLEFRFKPEYSGTKKKHQAKKKTGKIQPI